VLQHCLRLVFAARTIWKWNYLVFAYPKNVMDDLSDKQLARLAAVMQEEIKNG
jgi:hypothetical protein